MEKKVIGANANVQHTDYYNKDIFNLCLWISDLYVCLLLQLIKYIISQNNKKKMGRLYGPM